MKLTRVTITGADDDVNPSELRALSKEFPFVEWGILMSKSQQGAPRFPSESWCVLMAESLHENYDMNFAAHVCGRWARDLLIGNLDWRSLPSSTHIYGRRVQINTHAKVMPSTVKMMDDMRLMLAITKQFIFQADGVNDHLLEAARGYGLDAVPLFDKSGGEGVLPEAWPVHSGHHEAGFAGGLGPENVAEQVKKIKDLHAFRDLDGYDPDENSFWIDMESGVRTGGKFDLQKVKTVLEEVSSLVDAE